MNVLYFAVDEDEEVDADLGSASKRRRTMKNVKVKRSAFNRFAYHILAFRVLEVRFLLIVVVFALTGFLVL